MWSGTICLTFLFYCTCYGQIHLVSLKDQLANMTKKKLSFGKEDGGMKRLSAVMPLKTYLPSQWTQESEQIYNWPDGKVRYYIDEKSYGAGVKSVIHTAFSFLNAYATDGSCPYFNELSAKPIDGDHGGDWLHFTNPSRVRPCVHEAGKRDFGEIQVVIGYDCLNPRDVLHTILHGFGFRDEVSHPKRDQYVRVMWENIQPAFQSLFRVQSSEGGHNLADYDPTSIMHFHDRAFSVNGRPTIMSVIPGLKVEQSDRLTHLDMTKLQKIFGHECKKRMIGEVLYTSCGQNLQGDGGVYPNSGYGSGSNLCSPNNNGPVGKNGIVVAGKDVKLEKGELPDDLGSSQKLKGFDKIIPLDEGIIVGYDAENGGDSNSKSSD